MIRTYTDQQCYDISDLAKPLLGCPAIENLKLLARVQAIQTCTSPNPQLFTGLGKFPGLYTIKLSETAKPFSLHVPRRVAVPLTDAIKQELSCTEQLEVIVPVLEPNAWYSGMVVVPKPNGQVRICVDLTQLNRSACRGRYPLPAAEQILSQLAGATVFSKQLWLLADPLTPESALLTTFLPPFGCYCFDRLPFGITFAPEHFQQQMAQILRDLKGVVCLMDDVLICGRKQEERDHRLYTVLQTMQPARMILNKAKC